MLIVRDFRGDRERSGEFGCLLSSVLVKAASLCVKHRVLPLSGHSLRHSGLKKVDSKNWRGSLFKTFKSARNICYQFPIYRRSRNMEQNECKAQVDEIATEPDWTEELKNGGSLSYIDISDTSTGWTSIPGDFFNVRGPQYLIDRVKIPGGESLLQPLALDWLKSNARIDNVLKLPNNRVMSALDQAKKAGAEDPFVWAFNLQVPSKEHYSVICYFVSYKRFEEGSVEDLFLKGDDALKNTRLKLIANISEGPWIVKKAVGEQAICILGRSLTCRYVQGVNFIEVDVDIGSSIIANAIVHLAIGYLTTLTVDLAFLLESQTESELPEQILGTVRLMKMDLAAAVPVELLAKEAASEEEISFQSRLWRSFGLSTLMHPAPPLHGTADDEAA